MSEMRYLLVTHIPFAQNEEGAIILDRLWAKDLKGLVTGVGLVIVAAPRLSSPQEIIGWGPGTMCLDAANGLHLFPCP